MGKFLAFSSLDLPFHNIKSYREKFKLFNSGH